MIAFGYVWLEERADAHEAAACLRDRMLWEIGGIRCPRVVRLPGGKPVLADRTDVHFSVSHTTGLAVCTLSVPGIRDAGAFAVLDRTAAAPEVGVDAEVVRGIDEAARLRRIADRFLPTEAVTRIGVLPDGAYPAAFARLWTSCESAVKRDGRGFGSGFTTLSFDGLQLPQWTMHRGTSEYIVCAAWRTMAGGNAGGNKDGM